ncbi:MAG TPA: glycosyltransferase family 4 protein [Acidobacteriota bacterium]|jgi:glycosyltransferase involved in cell wall biosynthesis
MRLLAIYSTDQVLGGGEVSFSLSLELIRREGWNVLALIPGDGPLASYLRTRQIQYQIVNMETMRRLSGLWALMRPRSDWLQIASRYGPNLIHCNSVRAALYGQALGHKLGIPTILSARKTETDGWIDYFLMLRLDAILCISEAVRQRFPVVLGRKKLKVVYNAVDLALFQAVSPKAQQLRRQWQAGSPDYLAGVVGRLSPVKGQQRLILAAPRILHEVPQTRFVFIGSEDGCYPGFQEQLRAQIRLMGLEERFVFAGFQEDIVSAYHALDLVLFPTSSEGFGRVIIEAGAARKALITSDIDVVREVLSPSLSDLMVPLHDTEALAGRTIDLLRHPDLRMQIARRLHEHVRSHFGLEAHRDQLLAVYREVMAY